ncbi:MAG: DUF302 domain-containing protein [Gammaproteobacteria bacterium]|jgi:hypothetical protein|nr:DUF302 domain-containing protein [Gammaproteobacteria bacterium]
MSGIINIVKWVLIVIGAIAVYYGVSLQVKYDGVTGKIISEVISPKLHPESMEKVYMPMTNTLLETGDITMASIVRVKVADDVTNEDVEEAMESIATEEGIRSVGMLPLSEMVELQTNAPGVTKGHADFKAQRFLKIFQYCAPRTAMTMVEHSDAFSAYLPCRLALIEDKQGQRWLYTLDMNAMIYGGAALPEYLLEKALEVQRVITRIQNGGAEGDF